MHKESFSGELTRHQLVASPSEKCQSNARQFPRIFSSNPKSQHSKPEIIIQEIVELTYQPVTVTCSKIKNALDHMITTLYCKFNTSFLMLLTLKEALFINASALTASSSCQRRNWTLLETQNAKENQNNGSRLNFFRSMHINSRQQQGAQQQYRNQIYNSNFPFDSKQNNTIERKPRYLECTQHTS